MITLTRGELREALTGLSKIINRTATVPILKAVRFDTDSTHITIKSTNLDETLVYAFKDAQADKKGVFIVSHERLRDLVKGAAQDKLEIKQAEKGQARVVSYISGRPVKITVPAFDPAEWPNTEHQAPTKACPDFLPAYRQLLPFTSTDETRYVLTGVYIDTDKKVQNGDRMCSTDGRRLTLVNSMALAGVKNSCIVRPSKFLTWSKVPTSARIGVVGNKDGQWLAVEAGRWQYTAKCIDGRYPNYRQVIPTEKGSSSFTITDDDVEVLRKVLPTLPGADAEDVIVLSASPAGNVVVAGKGKGDTKPTRFVLRGGSQFKGKAEPVGVNRRYFAESLAAGFRRFDYADPLSPLRSVDDKGAVHVLMPIRLPEAANARRTPSQPAVTRREKPMVKDQTPRQPSQPVSRHGNVLAACETAKAKIREAAAAVHAVTVAVKEAEKAHRATEKDLSVARTTLKKLKSLSF